MNKEITCGLLGRTLGHSYSPQIHAQLADYRYELFEREPEEVEAFLKSGSFQGLNVTIPYKKTVIPFLDELSDTARAIGAVNTIVRREDGTLFGDNTDAFGFGKMMEKAGITVEGKKCIVLGTGGASVMAVAVLRSRGASEIAVVSRSGEVNYENLPALHGDAQILVNTTPVGMYPHNGECLVDLARFPRLTGVLDVVYNPSRTALALQAEALEIPYATGLYMLVAQAKRSCERFIGCEIPDAEIDRIERMLRREMENIVIIGMPGSGKSTVAQLLSEKLGRETIDIDARIVEKAGKSIPEIFAESGEEGFRKLETECTAEAGKLGGRILSTGGGVVTREENYPLLHQNGTIFWLRRDFRRLPTDGRPISQSTDLSVLYEKRRPLYERFADVSIDNNGTLEETLQQIMEAMQ